MTRLGTEKKKIRRAPQNAARDPSDAPSNPAKTKDADQMFAEKVRDNKKLDTRVEYFRGKDFTLFLRNYPEIKEIKDLDAEDIVDTLLDGEEPCSEVRSCSENCEAGEEEFVFVASTFGDLSCTKRRFPA